MLHRKSLFLMRQLHNASRYSYTDPGMFASHVQRALTKSVEAPQVFQRWQTGDLIICTDKQARINRAATPSAEAQMFLVPGEEVPSPRLRLQDSPRMTAGGEEQCLVDGPRLSQRPCSMSFLRSSPAI
jgi:hypothetical protein